jgi:hypothetical protein
MRWWCHRAKSVICNSQCSRFVATAGEFCKEHAAYSGALKGGARNPKIEQVQEVAE